MFQFVQSQSQSRPELITRVSRSLGQAQCQIKNLHILPNLYFYTLIFHLNYLKCQGHLKAMVLRSLNSNVK